MTASINEFLSIEGPVDVAAARGLNGIHGLQGGVSAALLVRRMHSAVPADRELVAVTARFIRPLDSTIQIDVDAVKHGSVLSAVNASAVIDGKAGVQASAVFTAPQTTTTRVITPGLPASITGLKDAGALSIPPEFGPIAQRMEIRPALPILPYSGGELPVLCAWVRLTDEVPSADERLMILVDALAASYTAILREARTVPTVEMSVQLSEAAFRAEFDWVLVRSETTSADARGWLRETIDVWTETGVHLAAATQLRIIR